MLKSSVFPFKSLAQGLGGLVDFFGLILSFKTILKCLKNMLVLGTTLTVDFVLSKCFAQLGIDKPVPFAATDNSLSCHPDRKFWRSLTGSSFPQKW